MCNVEVEGRERECVFVCMYNVEVEGREMGCVCVCVYVCIVLRGKGGRWSVFSLSTFNVCARLTQVVMFAWQALLSAEPFF